MPARPIDSQITFVTVSDLDASGEFYGGVLGLDLVLDQGTCRIYRTTATSYLGICTHREDVSPQGVILTLVSDDVDGWYRELLEELKTRTGVTHCSNRRSYASTQTVHFSPCTIASFEPRPA